MKIFVSFFFSLCFVSLISAQTPQDLKSYLPEIPEWTISNDIEIFNPGNLFTRINGAAPLFIENNFKEMTSMIYTKGDDYITIQAYRHASPVDAFGMYSSERSSDMNFYKIGGEAQGDNIGLYCFAGCIYLKMQANNESTEIGETLRTIAKGLTEKIDPNATYPGLFVYFPAENRLTYSEMYIVSSYIGHEFLKKVYTCNYKKDEKLVQLFAIDTESKEEASIILNKYFEFTKQVKELTEGKIIVIKDKYNGDIPLVWKGRYLIGIFDENGDNSAPFSDGSLIELLVKKIDK